MGATCATKCARAFAVFAVVRTRGRGWENIVENIARAWRERDAREATGVGAYAKGLGRSAGRSRETLTRDD